MKVIARSMPVVLGPDLVRTDVLRDAAGLARDHVGLADGVEQSRLTVVDVTHDGHDRRTDLEVFLVLVLQLGVEVETEALEELLVLVLGRDHLDLVAELGAEHLEGRLVERLGRGGHLAQVEQDGHERAGLHGVAGDVLDLVGEVRDRRAAAHADDLAVAARDVDATDDRRRSRISNSCRFARRDLRCLDLPPPLPKAPAVPPPGPRPRPPPPPGRPAKPPAGARTGSAAGTLEAAAGTAGTTGAAGTLLERRATGTTGATGTTRATRTAPGAPGRGAPGRGACGRGMLPGSGSGAGPCPARDANGLLPGRGPAGRWPMPCARGERVVAGARGATRARRPPGAARRRGCAGAARRGGGRSRGAAGAAGAAGAGAGAAAAGAAGAGRGSRRRRPRRGAGGSRRGRAARRTGGAGARGRAGRGAGGGRAAARRRVSGGLALRRPPRGQRGACEPRGARWWTRGS